MVEAEQKPSQLLVAGEKLGKEVLEQESGSDEVNQHLYLLVLSTAAILVIGFMVLGSIRSRGGKHNKCYAIMIAKQDIETPLRVLLLSFSNSLKKLRLSGYTSVNISDAGCVNGDDVCKLKQALQEALRTIPRSFHESTTIRFYTSDETDPTLIGNLLRKYPFRIGAEPVIRVKTPFRTFSKWLSLVSLLNANEKTMPTVALVEYDRENLHKAHVTKDCKEPLKSPHGEVCFATKAIPLSWEALLRLQRAKTRRKWINACFHEDTKLELEHGNWQLKINPGKREPTFLDCYRVTGSLMTNYADFDLPEGVKDIYFVHNEQGFSIGRELMKIKRALDLFALTALGNRVCDYPQRRGELYCAEISLLTLALGVHGVQRDKIRFHIIEQIKGYPVDWLHGAALREMTQSS